jgi:hypothetical protein
MKRTLQLLLTLGFTVVGTGQLSAQEKPQLEARLEEESVPLIFSYAPDYDKAAQQEREALAAKIARIDSLDISDTKRYKLIRDIYRNKDSKRLTRALTAEDPLDAKEELQLTGQGMPEP